ncbi:hypothetical protein BDA99DRAFT_539288 [Phascolomyces articulosus]|uniref:Uncharacterized protein n=1 Tax=Phascolomyces articulosus TaxID=60185 RepID=A0AAD5K6H3_9FUNG|nr:hypothetical protein BDA99DRAFT_539288 [Phascolomyces articulosus]
MYLLNNQRKAAISQVISATQTIWPETFEGHLKDVLKQSKDMVAVDYIISLLYIIPAIVAEQLGAAGCSTEAIDALMALVKACSVASSWVLTHDNIDCVEAIFSEITKCHEFARSKLPLNLYMANLHYARHLPLILRHLGCMPIYSARCMERSVGLFDRKIKSSKVPGANSGKQVYVLAARRHYNKADNPNSTDPPQWRKFLVVLLTRFIIYYVNLKIIAVLVPTHRKGAVGEKTDKLYVFDASNIVFPVGVIQSSIHKGRFHYVYENMMNESLELGLHFYN